MLFSGFMPSVNYSKDYIDEDIVQYISCPKTNAFQSGICAVNSVSFWKKEAWIFFIEAQMISFDDVPALSFVNSHQLKSEVKNNSKSDQT